MLPLLLKTVFTMNRQELAELRESLKAYPWYPDPSALGIVLFVIFFFATFSLWLLFGAIIISHGKHAPDLPIYKVVKWLIIINSILLIISVYI